MLSEYHITETIQIFNKNWKSPYTNVLRRKLEWIPAVAQDN